MGHEVELFGRSKGVEVGGRVGRIRGADHEININSRGRNSQHSSDWVISVGA
jgi:hypothetical protein